MNKIVVTGVTGFIGGHLVRALIERGDRVTALGRDRERVAARFGSDVHAVAWSGEDPGAWVDVVDGQDAVVHLAGERAVGVRWTDAAKQRIKASRIDSTRRLVAAIGSARQKPGVFVCASAVGYYGAHPHSEPLGEDARAGADFLAEVCVSWEAAALEAETSGVRVVLARFGIVLGPDGGALAEMVKPFKLFAGGPIGSGEQAVSWVHVDDAVAILLRAIDDPSLSGPINVVAPNAVTNAELSRAIGRALGRPSWLRVPAAALKARFGEGAGPLLEGQRAVPAVLERNGYRWRHPDVAGALAAALGAE